MSHQTGKETRPQHPIRQVKRPGHNVPSDTPKDQATMPHREAKRPGHNVPSDRQRGQATVSHQTDKETRPLCPIRQAKRPGHDAPLDRPKRLRHNMLLDRPKKTCSRSHSQSLNTNTAQTTLHGEHLAKHDTAMARKSMTPPPHLS